MLYRYAVAAESPQVTRGKIPVLPRESVELVGGKNVADSPVGQHGRSRADEVDEPLQLRGGFRIGQ
jgi:hypothetical protein